MGPAAVAARFLAASTTLAAVRDIVDERPTGIAPPGWCTRRGWEEFLAGLSDADVLGAEREGLAQRLPGMPDAPSDLVELACAVARSIELAPPRAASPGAPLRRASPRKRAQVAAFATLAGSLAPDATRIVDVGSGHGHLTRHLAEALQLHAVGWERDPARVRTVRALSAAEGPVFVELDALTSSGVERADLVVGLHCCGELGDHAVRAARDAGAALALVGCCYQKRPGDRPPLVVPAGLTAAALTLPRAVLGCANAIHGEDGVEADLATRSISRANRLALRGLLVSAGASVAPGEEMRGVNRRRATGTLADLAGHVFARRGLATPTSASLREASQAAARAHARVRRWALPRTMLGRLVETWIALDRAMLLGEAGHEADVVLAFDAVESPRNVAVVARAR